jgi:hypothetical protein
VYAVNQQWIYTSPAECYYLIFVNWFGNNYLFLINYWLI